jgi:hypothetical protein
MRCVAANFPPSRPSPSRHHMTVRLRPEIVQIRRHDGFVGAGLTQQAFPCPMPYATMSAPSYPHGSGWLRDRRLWSSPQGPRERGGSDHRPSLWHFHKGAQNPIPGDDEQDQRGGREQVLEHAMTVVIVVLGRSFAFPKTHFMRFGCPL